MAAGMIVAGVDADTAADFVSSSSCSDANAAELRRLSAGAVLWNDLRGELMMLAEDLEPSATDSLLRSLSDLAAASTQPALAFDLVDHCAELLGAR